jgi:peptidoglycan hydrolase-like protein with peptidoglycan-binding domain
VIAPGELTATNYGDSTVAAVRAFRQQYGLPAEDTVDLSTGRLMHAASTFAGSGGRVALHAAVREAAAAADTSQPQELYWLTRYALLGFDYGMAEKLAQRIPDHPDIRAIIDPILDLPDLPTQADPGQPPATPQPRPPEVPYPENFYSYRRPWVNPSAVEHVDRDWTNLQTSDFSPPQGAGGPPAIAALRQWHEGNEHFNHRRYAAAISSYDACQDSVLDYFDKFYLNQIELPAGNRTERLVALIKLLDAQRSERQFFWDFIQRRRELLSLAELEEHDRISPGEVYDNAKNFVSKQLGDPTLNQPPKNFRETNL